MWKVIELLHSEEHFEKQINGSNSYYRVIESTQRSPFAPQQLQRIISVNWTRRYFCKLTANCAYLKTQPPVNSSKGEQSPTLTSTSLGLMLGPFLFVKLIL